MNAYCPAPGIGPNSPSDNNYSPGFSSDLMLKDLILSQIAAKSVDADTPMGDLGTKLYKTLLKKKMGLGRIFPLCSQGLKRNPAIEVNKFTFY